MHRITAYEIVMLSFPCRCPTPLSYQPGNSMHAYLQAQMQQQQHQQQQQQHATAQQQRSETSSSRPISGLPSKSTSQEKSQQQQSVVSQQQKAVEQAAAAQQPLMAPGVMTQPLGRHDPHGNPRGPCKVPAGVPAEERHAATGDDGYSAADRCCSRCSSNSSSNSNSNSQPTAQS